MKGQAGWFALLLILVVFLVNTDSAKQRKDKHDRRIRSQHRRADVLKEDDETLVIWLNESTPNSSNGTAPTTTAATSGNQTALNVVLLYVDDWAANVLGFLDDLVYTPHLDALAAEGQWFPHSYVTTSNCWQSRATMLTGQYVGKHKHFQHSDTTIYDNWNQTLFSQLRNVGGYHVGYVGKYHAPMPAGPMAEAFDFFRPYAGAHWMERDNQTRHITELNQADALEFLRKRPLDQKFALAVSFYATHSWNRRPFPEIYSPQDYTKDLYGPNVSIPRSATESQEAWESLPYFFRSSNQGRRNWHWRGLDTEAKRRVTLQNLYRMAKEVDDAIGAIIQELRNQKVYDETVLVFTADNGNYMGEYELAGKWWTHDDSIKVPLIVRDPRRTPKPHPTHKPPPNNVSAMLTVNRQDTNLPMKPAGIKRQAQSMNVALNIDLAPTMLAAAKIPVPDAMQGRDLAAAYLPDHPESSIPFRTDFFYEWNRGTSLNGSDHSTSLYRNPSVFALIETKECCHQKYIYWPQAELEQLFNLTLDPTEQTDSLEYVRANRTDQYDQLRDRYSYLKMVSQRGDKIW